MSERILTRVHSLRERLDETLLAHRNHILAFLSRVEAKGEGILQHHQLIAEFEAISEENRQKLLDGPFGEVLRSTQEAIVSPPWIALAVRPRPGVWEYIRINVHALVLEELSVPEYLHFKEELVDGSQNGNFVLELDFEPFTASSPRPTLTKSIGNGVEFLNRHLSAKLFHDKESMLPLLEFLKVHSYKGKTMMLNDRIHGLNALQYVLRKAEEYLTTLAPETPYSEFAKTPVSDQSISRSISMDMNSEQVKESIESPTPSHLESPAPSHPSPVNPFLPPHPASSTPSRWAYRSRIPGMKSPSSDSISEGRPVLPPLSNDSTRASRGGSSDGWSMNAYSELTATPHRERWSFDSESSGLNHDKLTRSSSRVSSSTSVDLQVCRVCSKYLTEKSSRNSQKIFSGNELAVVAVLICGHAYHAECLEHMTPEVNKYDPACPVCTLGEKQTLKLSRKAVKAGMIMKIGKKKRSRHTNVYSHVTGDSVEFERMKNSEHERKGGAKMASSSSTTKPPFLKRHFSFGSKARSSSGNHSTKKKSFFWAKSSKV